VLSPWPVCDFDSKLGLLLNVAVSLLPFLFKLFDFPDVADCMLSLFFMVFTLENVALSLLPSFFIVAVLIDVLLYRFIANDDLS